MNRKDGAGRPSARGTAPPAAGSRAKTAPKCGPAKGAASARPSTAKQGSKAQQPAKPPGRTKDTREAFPAFSMTLPPPASYQEQQKEKQKIIRRNKPKGEDINKLKQIVRSVRDRPTNAHEFIGLVAPSSGDNGQALRSVLADELCIFRTTSRKIYETMTEDISDVLVNEQIQLKEYSLERHALYEEKMQRNLNEILEYCPEFNFELFFTKDDYLDELFPLAEMDVDPEELEALLRQEAYHRYQWLNSEGNRLKQENTRLQKRLRELKKRQKNELDVVAEKEQKAEETRKLLEAAQEILEERLEDLNESLGKSLVESELAQAVPLCLRPLPPKPKITEKFKARKSAPKKPDWASTQAAEIEANKTREGLHAETSKVSLRGRASTSKTAMKNKFKRAPQRPPTQGPSSPFHYSPPKSPPREAPARPPSPFHYSPIKSPTGAIQRTDSPIRSDYGRTQAEDEGAIKMKVSTSSVVTEKQRGGRIKGPRDSWRGFN